jgi:CP family cyanate transporter-like MFS transporter
VRALLVVGVVAVALNLRPAVVALGPVLARAGEDTGLGAVELSALAAAPVLCFGLVGALGGLLVRRRGIVVTQVVALLVLALGSLLRLSPTVVGLVAGTVVAASGIAVLNVVLPVAVKRYFPAAIGLMTGVYSTALGLSAAVAAGVTVPFADAAGWRPALAVWAVPAVVAAAVWLLVGRARVRPAEPGPAPIPVAALLRDPVAWHVTLFMGLQSSLFYATLSWLPSIHAAAGHSAREAGLQLGVVTAVGVPMAMLVPPVAARLRHQGLVATLLVSCTGAGLVLLLLGAPAIASSVLLGIGLGGSFPLALTLVSLRTRTAADATGLSSMTQGIGYLVAALGPLGVGALLGTTGAWEPAVVAMLVVVGLQLVAGLLASRPVLVGR